MHIHSACKNKFFSEFDKKIENNVLKSTWVWNRENDLSNNPSNYGHDEKAMKFNLGDMSEISGGMIDVGVCRNYFGAVRTSFCIETENQKERWNECNCND